MTKDEAVKILDALARGVDPSTGETLGRDSCLGGNPDVIRALFKARDALQSDGAKTPAPKRAQATMAGKAWSAEEDERLLKAYDADASVKDLSLAHARSRGAITARLIRLGRITEAAAGTALKPR